MAEKILTIRQKVQELIFDIRNKSHLVAQAREGEGEKGYQAVSNIQVTDEEDNDYQIRRSLATAYASLKSLLGEYLYKEYIRDAYIPPVEGEGMPGHFSERLVIDNIIHSEIDSGGELVLELLMPGNYNNASAERLSENIHSYLVNMSLAEWFAITSKEDAQGYATFAEANVNAIKSALYKRNRPERPIYR